MRDNPALYEPNLNAVYSIPLKINTGKMHTEPLIQMDNSPRESGSLNLSRVLRPVADASFSLLDDRPVLFSESAQKIYELNQVAAYIWCSLLDGKTAETICGDLESSGLERSQARTYVQESLRSWFKLGLLAADWQLRKDHSFSAEIGKLAVSIQTSSEQLKKLLTPLFNRTGPTATACADTFEVIDVDGLVYTFHNKSCVLTCALNELVPSLKAYLTEQIVLRCRPDVAFHAACLLSDGKALLISGAPGAGKTTLTLHLMASGLEYRADDIVLIAPDGNVSGVPFAPTVKSGAWEMVGAFHPELAASAAHVRADGQHVRYLEAPPLANGSSSPVGWIVFLKRVPGSAATLTPLGQLDTMQRLIDGSYSADGKLSHPAFHAIKRMLGDAALFELTYSDATEANAALLDLCHVGQCHGKS
jgi:hypothetical protein